MVCINKHLSLPHEGCPVDICDMPALAYHPDPDVRKTAYLSEQDIINLLAVIGAKIAIPTSDFAQRCACAPDKKLYNQFKRGKESLEKLMSTM